MLRRPETTFLWYLAPLKSLYFMVWQRNRWKVFLVLCIVFLFLLIAAFLYAAPVSLLGTGQETGPKKELF